MNWKLGNNARIFKIMNAKDHLEYSLFRGLVGALRFMPLGPACELLGMMSILVGRVSRFRRQVVLEQLAMVFPNSPDSDLSPLADRVYDNLGRTVAEVFSPRLDDYCASAVVDPGWGPV